MKQKINLKELESNYPEIMAGIRDQAKRRPGYPPNTREADVFWGRTGELTGLIFEGVPTENFRLEETGDGGLDFLYRGHTVDAKISWMDGRVRVTFPRELKSEFYYIIHIDEKAGDFYRGKFISRDDIDLVKLNSRESKERWRYLTRDEIAKMKGYFDDMPESIISNELF